MRLSIHPTSFMERGMKGGEQYKLLMVIFIDESGTHKQSGHAVNAVVYIQIENLEKVEEQMRKILAGLKLDSFHWAEHGWKVNRKRY